MDAAVRGAAAGALATVVMSLPMLVARRLRVIDRQPPQEITHNLTAAVHLPAAGTRLRLTTAVAHLAFGACAGALFSMALRTGVVVNVPLLGPTYGALIWLLSYRGVLPRVGLIRGEEDAGTARDVVMLLAHLVYGVALGSLTGGSGAGRGTDPSQHGGPG